MPLSLRSGWVRSGAAGIFQLQAGWGPMMNVVFSVFYLVKRKAGQHRYNRPLTYLPHSFSCYTVGGQGPSYSSLYGRHMGATASIL